MRVVIEENIANEIRKKYEDEDLEKIINILLAKAISQNTPNIEDYFGKVDFFEDYDYKKMRRRNESIG